MFLCHLQLRKADSLRSQSFVNTEIPLLPIAKFLCDALIINDKLSRKRPMHLLRLSFAWHWTVHKEKEGNPCLYDRCDKNMDSCGKEELKVTGMASWQWAGGNSIRPGHILPHVPSARSVPFYKALPCWMNSDHFWNYSNLIWTKGICISTFLPFPPPEDWETAWLQACTIDVA